MNKFMTTVALIVTTAALPGMTMADKQKAEKLSPFELLDTDRNGVISAEEATSNKGLANAFTKMDRDGNKELDKNEYGQFISKTVKKSG